MKISRIFSVRRTPVTEASCPSNSDNDTMSEAKRMTNFSSRSKRCVANVDTERSKGNISPTNVSCGSCGNGANGSSDVQPIKSNAHPKTTNNFFIQQKQNFS